MSGIGSGQFKRKNAPGNRSDPGWDHGVQDKRSDYRGSGSSEERLPTGWNDSRRSSRSYLSQCPGNPRSRSVASLSSSTTTSQHVKHQQTRSPWRDNNWRPRRSSFRQSDNRCREGTADCSMSSGAASSLCVKQQQNGRDGDRRPWKNSVSEGSDDKRKMAIASSMPYDTLPSRHVGLKRSRSPGRDGSGRSQRTILTKSDPIWDRAALQSMPYGTAPSLCVKQQRTGRPGRDGDWRPWTKSVYGGNRKIRKTAPSLHVESQRSRSPGRDVSWRSRRTILTKSDAIWDRAALQSMPYGTASSLCVKQQQTGRPGGDGDWRRKKSVSGGNEKIRKTAPSLHVESQRSRSPGKKDGSVDSRDVQNGQFNTNPCERINAFGVTDNSAYVLNTIQSVPGNPTPSGASGKKDGSVDSKDVQNGQFNTDPCERIKASGVEDNSAHVLNTTQSIPGNPTLSGASGTNFPQPPEQRILSSSEFQSDTLCFPAVEVIWEGNFEVRNLSRNDKTCKEFVGHPSVNIHRKALEFCKQLPEVMQFDIHPRHAFWPREFQMDPPDGGDVAFYFYPENNESKDRYDYLLKHLQKEDSMLRSQMGNVELLVFPSNVLTP